MGKTIITVVEKDTVGIITKVCMYLADNQINILDISQTIVQGFFNMMMTVNNDGAAESLGAVLEELERLDDEIDVKVGCQREEIFTEMYRI